MSTLVIGGGVSGLAVAWAIGRRLPGEAITLLDASERFGGCLRTADLGGFVRADVEFVLTTVHVLWGDRPGDRVAELTAFAQWMRQWAERPDARHGGSFDFVPLAFHGLSTRQLSWRISDHYPLWVEFTV